MKNKYRVQDSNIHGKGLFAAKSIKEGELLGYVKAKPAKKDGPHVLWCENGETPYKVTCDFRFINHTSDPNVAYYDDLSIVALRDIEPGEELTHYYGEGWD